MNLINLFLLFLFFAPSCSYGQVSVHLEPVGRTIMNVKITNETSHPVVVHGAALPWFPNALGIRMKAVPVSIPYKEYGQFFIFGDDENLSLESGETVSKEIDVRNWFQRFDTFNKDSPVIVYWKYFPAVIGYEDVEPSGGVLLIPKMK